MVTDILFLSGEIILLAIGGVLLLYRLGTPTLRRRTFMRVRLSLLLVAFFLACVELVVYAGAAHAALSR